MIKNLNRIFKLLEKNQIKSFFSLQILIIFSSLLQLISITAFGPFIALISDNSILTSNNLVSKIYLKSGMAGSEFIFSSGILILFLIIFSSIVSFYSNWRLNKFSWKITMDLSKKLYKSFITQDWIFHTLNPSSKLIKQIFIECRRLGDSVISPIINISSSLVYIIIVIILTTLYNPLITIISSFIFLIIYVIIYSSVKNLLRNNGENITNQSLLRSSTLTDSFGAIREIIINNKQGYFIKRFNLSSDKFGYSQATNAIINTSPKFFIELIAFSSIIILFLIFFSDNNESFTNSIPVLSVFALISIKLIPHFQIIFSSISKIKGNFIAFDLIEKDILDSQKQINVIRPKKIKNQFSKISLKNISYKYPGKENFVLENLNLIIEKNKNIGFVGYSGSGKSTLVDIISELVSPSSGEIFIDNKKLSINKNELKDRISLVSQNIDLINGSIKSNIAFGQEESEIDIENLNLSISKSNLKDFIKSAPHGINTEIGERGVQISGGQRQRIGIARAIYNKAQILILDEATSSLDGITESEVLKAVKNISKSITVISIAHRLSTLIECDIIYVLHKGKIVNSGTFEYLSLNDEIFKKMQNKKS
tara:strand:- start:6732 stop:8519 length:1788 start_codon:yes stop_codon:yes gene_type:complete